MIGLVALNLGFLAAGLLLLWGLGAIETMLDGLQLLGVALLAGAAAVVMLALQLTIVGVGVRASLFAALAVVAVAGCLLRLLRLGAMRVRRRPPAESRSWLGWLAALVAIVPLAVYLAMLFRLAPQLGVWEPDAVTTWTLRAKSLYFSNGLDVATLREAGAFAYPLFESMLQALDFVALGKADDLAFHVQFAILLTSFLAGVAGVTIRAGASAFVAWPLVALFAITPEIQSRGLSPLADLTLDYLFALAALLFAVWLVTRAPWLLVTGTILLAAAISTKREGILLAAVAFVALLVASLVRTGRSAVVPVVVAGVCALATFVPWRIWIAVHGSATDVGNISPQTLHVSTGQLGPAARLLGNETFTYGAWLLVVPLALVLAAAALLLAEGAARHIAGFFLVAGCLGFLGFLAIWWLVPDLQTAGDQEQPAVRLVGALVALSVALAPLLAASLWESRAVVAADDREARVRGPRRRDERAAMTADLG